MRIFKKYLYIFIFDNISETILYLFQLNMITTNIYYFDTVAQVAVINLIFACLVFIHFNVLFLILSSPAQIRDVCKNTFVCQKGAEMLHELLVG